MFYTTRQKRYLMAETLPVQRSIYDPYRIQLCPQNRRPANDVAVDVFFVKLEGVSGLVVNVSISKGPDHHQ